MKKIAFLIISLFIMAGSCNNPADYFEPAKTSEMRAPAYPLITIDPYTSAWSFTDKLNEDAVRHWTGKKFPLLGAIRVDNVAYRFMGVEELPLTPFLPTAATERWEASYTEKEPSGDWTDISFNDSGWKTGKAAYGTTDMPNLSTQWESEDIWVRRTFTLEEDYSSKPVYLEYSHDDDFELYINNIKVVETGYSWNNNVLVELPEKVKQTLRKGKNVIASHGHNRVGGAYVDFGLYIKEDLGSTFESVAIQKSVNVLPTQTYYTFTCGPVELDVVFTSPLLLDDLDLMSTPVNFLSYRVRSTDNKKHNVQVYIEASPDWAKNTPEQETETTVSTGGEDIKLTYAKTGTVEQPILQKKGDNVRIDWGYFYMASPKKKNIHINKGEYHESKKRFIAEGFTNPANNDAHTRMNGSTVMVFCEDFKEVTTPESGFVMIGYDDIYAVQYFHENLPAYWKHNGKVDILRAFEKAASNYDSIMKRCAEFDNRLMEDAQWAGGKEYAELCALAYRQAVAAHKLVEDKDGNLLFLSKENFSNGSIGTVDISYPSSPLFLIYNPGLLKGMLNPIFYFSESGKWNKPYPAHDVGTYPIANGQTYGEDMPVEEAGNMLIMTAAIAMVEGHAGYAKQHWPVLTTWANYLMKEGLDPDNQLCTDDFAGHLAHNANLSIKAIMGIAGYGKMAEMLGDSETAGRYISTAREMAKQWERMADDGDHYRLTFDQPDTWSQKYNLIWDKLFNWNIFPTEIARKEINYYLTKQNRYGLPLDSRKDYTKSDWIIWSACLAEDDEQFNRLFMPVYTYANETTSRVPISDWHGTNDAVLLNFRARSVVGGYFMKMLMSKMNTDGHPVSSQLSETLPAVEVAETRIYNNPVIGYSLPDPTIIQANDGYFYLYATEDIRNLPIHRSKDLVYWEMVGTAFTDESRPTFEPKGGIWAPDIEYINGQYVLYYSMSVWGGHWTCGIGAAVSDRPEGPFTDKGPLFISKEIDVENSIDQFYIEDKGKKYLFWGSFHGLYAIELSEDGLSVKEGAQKQKVAGNAYEAVYIHKRNGYYYMFASIGSCCEGVNSTYTTVAGRSENLFGPYTDKQGKRMLDNNHEIIIQANNRFVGTGHNSEIVTDDNGDNWIFYHAVDKENPAGRVLLMDRVEWQDEWPVIKGGTPSLEAIAPYFN